MDILYYQKYEDINKFSKKYFKKLSFSGKANKRINYYSYTSNTNNFVIFISPGRAEFFHKYLHFLIPLIEIGFDIYFIDHRGQGQSERLTKKDLNHVESFNYYVEDFKTFYKLALSKRSYEKRFLFCHSLGSLIALLAQTDKNISFDATFYSSPLIKIKTNVSEFVENCFVRFFSLPIFIEKKMPLYKTFENSSFSDNTLTSSFSKYKMLKKLTSNCPDLQVGTPSFNWVIETLSASKLLFRKKFLFENMNTVVFQSEIDLLVDNSAHDLFFKNFKDVKFHFFNEAKHELLWEDDKICSFIVEKIKSSMLEITYEKKLAKINLGDSSLVGKVF